MHWVAYSRIDLEQLVNVKCNGGHDFRSTVLAMNQIKA